MTFRTVTDIIVKDLICDIDSLPRNTVDDFPMDYAIYILFEKEIHALKIKTINKKYLKS